MRLLLFYEITYLDYLVCWNKEIVGEILFSLVALLPNIFQTQNQGNKLTLCFMCMYVYMCVHLCVVLNSFLGHFISPYPLLLIYPTS